MQASPRLCHNLLLKQNTVAETAFNILMQDWALSKLMCKQCCVAAMGWL